MEVKATHSVTGASRTFAKGIWDALPSTRINGVLYPKMGYVIKQKSVPKEAIEENIVKKVKKANEDTVATSVQP